MPTVALTGIAELRRALLAAPPEIARELPKALRQAAEPARAAAAARAPVSKSARSGHRHLAQSVRVRANSRGAAVGSALIQAPIVHFGHRARVSGGKVKPHIRHLTPKPWLIPAVEGQAAHIEEAAGRAIQSLLDRLVGS